MNKRDQEQLLFVASVDFACIGTGPGTDGEGLDGAAVLADSDGWARLRVAAQLQEEDDRGCDGYLVKAWAIDPISGQLIDSEVWINLCQDQKERICQCFA